MMIANVHGREVDTSGPRWMLDETTTVSFPGKGVDDFLDEIVAAEKKYVAFLIPRYRPTYIRSRKDAIEALIRLPNLKELLRCEDSDIVSELKVRWANDNARNTLLTKLKYVRDWYAWSADQGFVGFDPDVATLMEFKNYGGMSVGQAVLRLDENGGPLTEGEAASLNKALWSELRAVVRGDLTEARLPLRVIVAALLMAVLGPNPANLRQLEEVDLRTPTRPGDPFILMMPRAKKAGIPWRGAFKERVLTSELGNAVQLLIEENKRLAPPGPTDRLFGRPLFRRKKQDERLEGTAFAGAAFRVHDGFFRVALEQVVEKLDVKNRFGNPLALYPRRLRYTVAKRLVARGATPLQLMDILDHSSVSRVLIYYNSGLEMVPHLNKTLGPLAKSIALLFGGRHASTSVVLEPALRKLFRAQPRSVDSVAPKRCLDCPKFQARDAAALRRLATKLRDDVAVSEDDMRSVRRAQAAAQLCDSAA